MNRRAFFRGLAAAALATAARAWAPASMLTPPVPRTKLPIFCVLGHSSLDRMTATEVLRRREEELLRIGPAWHRAYDDCMRGMLGPELRLRILRGDFDG